MVQRKVKIIIALLCMFLFTGYTYPEGTPYITISSSAGELTIYFTKNTSENIIYDETNLQLINISNSTIYGYTTYSDTEYRVYFPTFDDPYIYQSYNNSIEITEVTVLENYHVQFYSKFNADITTYAAIIIIFLLFFIWFKG